MRLYFYRIHATTLVEKKGKLISYNTILLKDQVPLIKMVK